MTWTAGNNGETLNSAAHSTPYADPATATVEPQCTAAASDYIKAALDGHNEKRKEHQVSRTMDKKVAQEEASCLFPTFPLTLCPFDLHVVDYFPMQANAVVWDENLSCIAQRQADTCVFDRLMYVNGGGYGQNLAGGTSTTITDSIEMWYGDAAQYDSYYGQSDPPFVAGHFTQLVWASTTSIGCATKSCDGSTGTFVGELTVCNYFVFGNMGGAYKENVLPAVDSGSGSW